MKVLVVGGMHGNEPLGIDIVSMLRTRPVKGVNTLLANEKAVRANRRFIQNDLNRSFPGIRTSDDYEPRRAAEVVAACNGYDIVLDFHNTQCPDNDCSFVGNTAHPLLFKVSGWLGLNRVIVADYDCLNKYAPNCISVEISTSSDKMKAADWIVAIEALARLDGLPEADGLELYTFVYRMTQEDRRALQLDTVALKAFEPIDARLANAMQVQDPAYPIFIGDGYTPYNYGGLLNRINV